MKYISFKMAMTNPHVGENASCNMSKKRKNDSVIVPSLHDLSKEELIGKVEQLECHVKQLRNIIAKAGSSSSKKENKQKPFDFSKYNTRHVALKIVYLGWDYQGFAVQEDTDKTIEAALFNALLKTRLIESRETACYHRCGRTDKGVSAFGQVISIDLRTALLEGIGVKVRTDGTAHERPGDKTTEIRYVHILNKVLPPEIRVLAWCPVNEDFSARFSCKKRTYKYFIPKGSLNIEKMREAATKLVGEHDFRNLCKMDVGNGVVNFNRNIESAVITRMGSQQFMCEDEGFSMYELTIIGQAFLWHQIRCIVAVLILIGKEKEQPQIIDELFDVEKNPRKPQYTMASELPLVLFDCQFENIRWIYDRDWHRDNIKHLQEMWTHNCVRSSMLSRMLEDLESVEMSTGLPSNAEISNEAEEAEDEVIRHQVECLLPGNKARIYKPLLERPKCDSLEDRIEHYAKRRKIAEPTEAKTT